MQVISEPDSRRLLLPQKGSNLFAAAILFSLFFPSVLFAANNPNYHKFNQNKLFSSENKYQPYFEIGGVKYFNQNSTVAGIYDLFIPLLQKDDQLLFTDLRLFDRSGSSFEGNAHLGYRKLYSDTEQMFGIYGAFDRKRTAEKNCFNQLTFGFEYWQNKFFVGGNLYKPIGTTQKLRPSTLQTQISPNFNFSEMTVTETQVTSQGTEKSLPGADLELGYAITDNLTGYAGGYYFAAHDTKTVAGPRARFTYDYKKPTGRLLGILDGISIEAGVQHDKPRRTSAYIGIKFKIGLTNLKRTSNIQGFDRHMVELVRRDPDIVYQPTEIPYVTINIRPNIPINAQHIIDRFGISSETTPQELIRIHGYLLNYLVSHLIDADKVMKAGIYYLHLIYEAGIALIPSFADAAQSCWDEIKDPKTWWKSSNIFERVLGKKGFSEIPKAQQDLIRTVHTEDIIKIQGIINIKDIKRLYRQAVFICHPDKGGTAEDFEALTSITKELEENILSLTAGKSANTSQQNTDTTPNSTPQYSTSTTTPVTPANTPVPVSGTPEQPDSATDAFPTDLPSVASMRSNITARAPTPGYSRRLFSWADDGIAKQEQHIFPTPPIVAEGCCPINGMSIANMTTTEEIKELQKKSQAPTTEQHVSGVSSTSNGVVKGAFAYWLTTQPLKLVLEPSSKDHPAIIWFAFEYPILRGLGSMEDKYINGKAFSFSTAMLQAFASDSYLYSSIFGIPLCEINNLDKILIPVASKHYLTANTKSTLEALEYYLPLYILAPELGKYIYLLCERFQDNWFCKPASNFAAFFVMHMSLKIDSDFNFVKNIINTIASAIDSHPLAVSTLASLVNLSILYLKLKPIVVAAKMGTSVSLFVPAPTVWSFASPSIEYFANSFVSGLSGKVVGTTLGTYAGVATITKLSGSGVAMFFSYVPSGTSFVVAAGGIVAATAVAIPAGIGTVLIVDHFITPQVEYATQTDYGKNIGIFTGAIGGAAAGMLVGVKVAAALSFIGIFGVPTIIGLGAGLGTFAALGTLIGMDVGHGVDNIIKCNTPHYEDCPWL